MDLSFYEYITESIFYHQKKKKRIAFHQSDLLILSSLLPPSEVGWGILF